MPKGKVYPRYTHKDQDFIVLHAEDSISKIDVDSLKVDADITKAMGLYGQYVETARDWYWIETGVELYLFPTEKGYTWCVEDNRNNAGDYRWLSNKARRFEQKIVERVNQVMTGEVPNVLSKPR